MKLVSFIVLSFLFCYTAFSIDKYPEWFLYPKLYPDCIIGFSFKDNEAMADAAYMYCLYKHCTMVGYTKDIDISNINYFQNIQLYFYSDNYIYLIDGNIKDSIENKLVYLDGFCNNVLSKGFVQLYTTKKDFIPTKKVININQIVKPDWVDKTFWEKEGYYYGVGLFSSFKNENEAWKRSEEKAIYSIVSSIQIEIKANTILKENNEKEFLINSIKTGFSCELNYIEPLERWIDIENEIFYTLIRIKKEDINMDKKM